jgi:F0F1-type ATP synthase assembly protein I
MDRDEPGRKRKKVAAPLSEAEEERLRQTRLRLIGLSMQFGFTIVGSFAVFMGGGIWLDSRLGTKPIFLLIGMALSFIAIGYSLYEIATIGYKPRAAKVVPADEPPVTPTAAANTWDDEPEPLDDWDRDDWKRDDDWPVQKTGNKSGGS